MDLNELIATIPDFVQWNHPEKIRFFGWYLHTERNQNRFGGADIGQCYTESHTERPTSISPFLNDMHNRKPKMLLRDGDGWYLERSVRGPFRRNMAADRPPFVSRRS
jgi:hypothetical protein